MEVRVLSQSDVERLLPIDECIEVMTRALATTSRGDAVLPLRQIVWKKDRSGMIGVMPAFLEEPRTLGLKIVAVFPGNEGTGFDSHQGAVMLFDTERGSPLAILDASSITAIRTAATSGVATRVLARSDASDLAILGSGVQAASHLSAIRAVRGVARVRVWSRTPAHARAFAEREGARHGLRIETMPTPRDAVLGADLICTTTSAHRPVLEGAWLSPGSHVNAVGACFASARELDGAAVARARVFVDRRESAQNEAGDILLAIAEGACKADHVAGELGEVLLGRLPGRRSEDEITLFESLGIATEDLAAADHAFRKAEAEGVGAQVELGRGRLAPA